MNITPTEMEWLDRNGDYLCLSNVEGTGDYISRKRRADLVKIVSRVLRDELSDNERKVLLDMVTQEKSATDLMKELKTSSSQIYRLRSRAEKRVAEIIKYVLLYRSECEQYSLPPIEFRNVLASANTRLSDCPSIVHRLRKLMAEECIGMEMLYKTPGLSKKSVNEIFLENRTPNVQEIIVLSNFFGTTADYLLKGDTICQKH